MEWKRYHVRIDVHYVSTTVYKNKSPTSKIQPWQPTWQPNAKLEVINVFILRTVLSLSGSEAIIRLA